MFAHLWTGTAPPREYVNYKICEKFGWTPEELRQQRASDILQILTFMSVESKIEERKRAKR